MDLLHGGGEVQRPESYEFVAPREERGAEGSDSWQERADSSPEPSRIHGTRLRELKRAAQDIAAQPRPRVTYTPRGDALPEAELSALATVYRFILSKSSASQIAVEPAPEPDGHDDAKEAWFPPGGGVLRGDGTSVGTVVQTRGGGHVETSPVSTDQRAQEDQ
jgi:hypothetical protein